MQCLIHSAGFLKSMRVTGVCSGEMRHKLDSSPLDERLGDRLHVLKRCTRVVVSPLTQK